MSRKRASPWCRMNGRLGVIARLGIIAGVFLAFSPSTTTLAQVVNDEYKSLSIQNEHVIYENPNNDGASTGNGTNCVDSKIFRDEANLQCSDWVGGDCNNPSVSVGGVSFPYSGFGKEQLLCNCPISCGLGPNGNCRRPGCVRRCRVDPGPFGYITTKGQGPVNQIPNYCPTASMPNGQSCVHNSMCASGYCSPYERQCHASATTLGFSASDQSVMTDSSVAIRMAARNEPICNGNAAVSSVWETCWNFGAGTDPSLSKCLCRFSFLLQYWSSTWIGCNYGEGKSFCVYFGEDESHLTMDLGMIMLLPDDVDSDTLKNDDYIKLAFSTVIKLALGASTAPAFSVNIIDVKVDGKSNVEAPVDARMRKTTLTVRVRTGSSQARFLKGYMITDSFKTVVRDELGGRWSDTSKKCRWPRHLISDGIPATVCNTDLEQYFATSYVKKFDANSVGKNNGGTEYQPAYKKFYLESKILEDTITVTHVSTTVADPSMADEMPVTTTTTDKPSTSSTTTTPEPCVSVGNATTCESVMVDAGTTGDPTGETATDEPICSIHDTPSTKTATTTLAVRSSVELMLNVPRLETCSPFFLVSQLLPTFQDALGQYLDIQPEQIRIDDAKCLARRLAMNFRGSIGRIGEVRHDQKQHEQRRSVQDHEDHEIFVQINPVASSTDIAIKPMATPPRSTPPAERSESESSEKTHEHGRNLIQHTGNSTAAPGNGDRIENTVVQATPGARDGEFTGELIFVIGGLRQPAEVSTIIEKLNFNSLNIQTLHNLLAVAMASRLPQYSVKAIAAGSQRPTQYYGYTPPSTAAAASEDGGFPVGGIIAIIIVIVLTGGAFWGFMMQKENERLKTAPEEVVVATKAGGDGTPAGAAPLPPPPPGAPGDPGPPGVPSNPYAGRPAGQPPPPGMGPPPVPPTGMGGVPPPPAGPPGIGGFSLGSPPAQPPSAFPDLGSPSTSGGAFPGIATPASQAGGAFPGMGSPSSPGGAFPGMPGSPSTPGGFPPPLDLSAGSSKDYAQKPNATPSDAFQDPPTSAQSPGGQSAGSSESPAKKGFFSKMFGGGTKKTAPVEMYQAPPIDPTAGSPMAASAQGLTGIAEGDENDG